MQTIIKQTQNYLYEFLNKSEFDQNEIDYRFEHSLRVANIGLDLAIKENANPKVAVIACLLHDLGKFESLREIDHGRVSAELAKPFLLTLELTMIYVIQLLLMWMVNQAMNMMILLKQK